MSERDRYIPGVPCWVDTSQPDQQAALAFYSGLFGWEFQNIMPESDSAYFVGRIRGQDAGAVAGLAEGAPPVATWNTYIWVENAAETASKVVLAGGTALTEPFDVQEHGRMAVLADPEGAVFCVWEARAHRGAAIVNEPGSVNFNGLHTRDLDRAKAFYGEVFGWTTLTVPGGMTAWTLPGYGDFLARDRPTIHEEMVALGAPGFEDVVATVRLIGDDQPGTHAHWDVTFAVDDADAIAATATELGGAVVVAPFDAPYVRMTVIADPQGATFIASKFVPSNRDGAGHTDAAVNAA